MKTFKKILATLLVVSSILFVSQTAKAAIVETVRYQWDRLEQTITEYPFNLSYDTNEQYKDIHYFHYYTSTDSTKDTTSWVDRLGSVYSRIHHYVTFTCH